LGRRDEEEEALLPFSAWAPPAGFGSDDDPFAFAGAAAECESEEVVDELAPFAFLSPSLVLELFFSSFCAAAVPEALLSFSSSLPFPFVADLLLLFFASFVLACFTGGLLLRFAILFF
jgi:hypothetical protein